MRKRGESIGRSFAHCYETGGIRRTHLRGHEDILKRLLIHVAGFNLSLVLRRRPGLGTARGLQGLSGRALAVLASLGKAWDALLRAIEAIGAAQSRSTATLARAA